MSRHAHHVVHHAAAMVAVLCHATALVAVLRRATALVAVLRHARHWWRHCTSCCGVARRVARCTEVFLCMLQRCLCHSSIFCSGTKKKENFHRYEVQRRFWWVAKLAPLCVVALNSGDFVRHRKK